VKRAMFVGRWQPCHLGHEWLIRQKLRKGIPCLILVRDIVPDERNPFTTDQTVSILESAFHGEDVIIRTIPDIESINWGRGVGYETNDHGECPINGISGTELRQRMLHGGNWRGFVSDKVAEELEHLLEQG